MNRDSFKAKLASEPASRTDAVTQVYCAPGRVNIIGEHTDYSEGFVLPTTSAAYTWLAATPRADRVVNVKSLNLNDEQSFNLDRIEPASNSDWTNYIKGVAAKLEEEGIRLSGMDIMIDSEIPIGGGLSSSAALEIVTAIALLDIAGASLPGDQVAKICQRAEIEYAGVNCGIMDQFAIACCKAGHAMLLDCRSLQTQQVRLPEGIRLLLTDSGVKHKLPAGEYNQRTDECARATEILAQHLGACQTLRDVSLQDLRDNQESLGDMLYRRARHVVSENERALNAFAALKSFDFNQLGELISASHQSLRDDFEVSCDEVNALVQIADSCDGVFGSRMIGAGFGGCVLSVIAANKLEQTMQTINRKYSAVVGEEPWMHVVSETEPAKRFGPL